MGRPLFFAARCYASAAHVVAHVRLFVRPSVTFVDSVKTNKRIFNFFSPPGSHTILVFRTKHYCNIPTGTSLTRASNAGGVGKNRDSGGIAGYQSMAAGRASNNCDGRPSSLSHRPRHAPVNLCLSQPGRIRQEKKTEQNLTVRSGKYEAEVTNNKRMCSTYCTIEANY